MPWGYALNNIATGEGREGGTRIPFELTTNSIHCSCDCFILKDILQNWSDEDVSLILTNLFKVVRKESRVLVMETILHTGSYSEERVSGSSRIGP